MKLYTPSIFKKSEIIHYFKTEKQYENWIYNKIKSNSIKKVKNGLYVLLDRNGYTNVNKFELASKINESSYISYHSTLEYYGIANQVFNIVTVSSEKKFRDFEFNELEYNYHKSSLNYGVYKDGYIKVTTLERTIIDCIDKIDLSRGIEEIINAFELIERVNEKDLLKII